MQLGVDTGGTFTDFVLFDGVGLRLHKVLSTPDDPARAVLQGMRELGVSPTDLRLVHGSTVATNAILERKGARTLFVANVGFEDLLFIGRQTRPELYNLTPTQPQPWLRADDCFGIGGRIAADGSRVAPLDRAALARLADRAGDYESVAICTLFSFLDPEDERAIAAALPGEIYRSISHRVLAEYGEYERAATTFLNSYVGPKVQGYLNRLESQLAAGTLEIMHSAGGLMGAHEAGELPSRLLLSGPAGGLVAARAIGRQLGSERLITFDMGGTSTDVALLDGEATLSTASRIAGLPVALPMLDMHTIGAGGGSIARLDAAGLLQVGPQSAGASPGPACYGLGGLLPSVTDANLLLGRIPPGTRLAGSLPLDRAAAEAAFARMAAPLGLTATAMAAGVLRLVEEAMVAALRVVSIERGFDPKAFDLFCFGGAGGLHLCALAEALGVKRAVVPMAGGAFSALGMLLAPRRTDLSRSRCLPLNAASLVQAAAIFAELEQEAVSRLPGESLTIGCSLEMRYLGQGETLTVAMQAGDSANTLRSRFAELHRRAYGHELHRPVELVTMRLAAELPAPPLALPPLPSRPHAVACGHSEVSGSGMVPYYARLDLAPGQTIIGPALVVEPTATLWLAPGWQLQNSMHGHLLLTRGDQG